MIASMTIIETEPSSGISKVGDKNSLYLVCLKGDETYKDAQIPESLTSEQ